MNVSHKTDEQASNLSQMIAQEIMAGLFENYFRQVYPERKLKVNKCQVGRVYHKPGKNFQVIYRLFGEDGEGQKFDQWISGRIDLRAKDKPQSPADQPECWAGCGYWKPVAYWEETRMLLHAFPYDPHLTVLSQLVDPVFIKEQIQKNLSGFGLTSEWITKEVVVHKVKYRPGKSCVLRYEAVLLDRENKQQRIHFYSKTYQDEKSRYVYDLLQNICASPACATGLLNIPRPIAHIEETNTVWQQAWEGINLNQLGRDDGWANILGPELISGIALMLATFHQIQDVDNHPDPGPSRGMMLENAKEDIRHICQFLPDHEEKLVKASETLAGIEENFASVPPQTLIHGTFKMAQILIRDNQLALVDFDSIAYGDPLCDVAEFIASLAYLTVGEENVIAAITRCSEQFIQEYQAHVPWNCDLRRLGWYVVIFLLGKIHASLKKLDSDNVKNLPMAFELVDQWLMIAQGKEFQPMS